VYDARTKDLLKAMRDHEAEGKGIWALLGEFDKERAAAAEADRRKELEDRDYALREKGFEETKRSNRFNQSIALKRAGTSEDKDDKWITVQAHPQDSQAVKDPLGRLLRRLEVTPDWIKHYASTALNDEDFMERHPEVYTRIREEEGRNVSYNYLNDEKIAILYAQEVYDRGYSNMYSPLEPKQQTKQWGQLTAPWWNGGGQPKEGKNIGIGLDNKK
jgi:hypothetical protein